MKKRILLILLVGLLFLAGCSKKEKEEENKPSENVDKIIIGDYDLTLVEKGSYEDATFKYPKGTVVSSLGTATTLIYPEKESDKALFKIGMSKFDNMTIEETMTGATFTKVGNVNFNNIEWIMYEDKDHEHSFATTYNNATYVFGFSIPKEYIKLEEEFMKTIKFK